MNSNKLFIILFFELCIVGMALFILFFLGQSSEISWHLFSLGLCLYFFWHIYNLFRLIEWLSSKQCLHMDSSFGIWSEICSQLVSLQQTSQSRQKKLVKHLGNYQTFVNKIPDAVIIISKDNTKQKNEIEWFNKRAQLTFQLKKKKHLGISLNDIFTDPAVDDFLSSPETNKRMELHSPLDKNKIFSPRILPYHKSSRLLLFRNISRIYWIDRMRKDFVANISHELRTPLTVIRGYLESFESYFEKDKKFLPAIQSMQLQSLRMGNLIQDLLVLSKLESDTGKDDNKPLLAVPTMIENVIHDIKVLHGDKKYTIKSDIDYSLKMPGYENEIQSVISNLINNAIRYTPSNSIILVRWYSNNNKNYFSVEDNGEGIEEKHLQRLTERFYRVDKGRSRSEGGTGLGLSIVKHVLNHHNAKLKIKSKPGEGSQFICCFMPDL